MGDLPVATQRVTVGLPGGDTMEAFMARPAALPDPPPVLVCQEIFGVNAHIRQVTERLAREGYLALAPDLFHRHAPGLELDYGPASIERGRAIAWGKCTVEELVTDVTSAFAFLRALPDVAAERLGVVGFCWGG